LKENHHQDILFCKEYSVETLMNNFNINPEKSREEITTFLRKSCQELNRAGLILGLSGGLDSSLLAYLAVASLGKEKVQAVYLPDKDSKACHREHAQQVADSLKLPFLVWDITPCLDALGVYSLLPLRYLPGKNLKSGAVKLARRIFNNKSPGSILHDRLSTSGSEWIAKGNAYINSKHRMRMVALYHQAERECLLVAGAVNRTEWLTGTFSKWGCDHCADINPLLHLYRSQIKSLAEYEGVPEIILNKAADPDLMPGLDDKEELLGPFEKVDLILYGLENGIDREILLQYGSESEIINLERLMAESEHMRHSPYSLL
jgi:NAD+ synthase